MEALLRICVIYKLKAQSWKLKAQSSKLKAPTYAEASAGRQSSKKEHNA